MSLSKIDIFNSALLKVSKRYVSSVDDSTFEAKTCNTLWEPALRSVLACHNWSSTIKRAQLDLITLIPACGYGYAYRLPNDCIKVVQAYRSDDHDDFDFEWVTEGSTILSDEEVVYIKYVAMPKNTEGMNSHFTEALIWNLAMRLCFPFTGDDNRERVLRQEYETVILPRAKAGDAMESREIEFEESPWIESLLGNEPSIGRA